jgi:transposase
MKAHTALINETRGLLHEYGLVVPPGALTFRTHVLATLAANEAKLTSMSQALFQQLEEELAAIEERLARYDAQLTRLARSHPVCQRLMTIPGLGELTATALVAAVSDAAQFKNGRQFAAWLGLVPRQHSRGGKSRLLGISKRGDMYLRTLLVHGARSCLRWVDRQRDRRSQWARSLLERQGWNRAAVALAHKNARVAWVLLRTDQVYCAANV